MTPKEEDFICFYRDAVIAGHDNPAAQTMRRFNLSRDYTVRLLNQAIARCDGLDIRNWNRRISSPESRVDQPAIPALRPVHPGSSSWANSGERPER
jgi:hypothetical protein